VQGVVGSNPATPTIKNRLIHKIKRFFIYIHSNYHTFITMATFYDPDFTPKLFDAGGDLSKRWYIDYRIWDTDKRAFVRKQYTGMNKYKSLRARRKISNEKLEEIRELISQGYTAGKAKVSLKPYDIRRLSLREALDYFLNNKNGSDTNGNAFILNEKHNPSGSISANTFKPYKNYRNQLLEWLESQGLQGIGLMQLDVPTANAFFDFLSRKKELTKKSHNNYLGFFRSVYTFYAKREENVVIRNPFLNIDKKKVAKSRKHVAYTNAQLETIRKKVLDKGDKQLYLFIHFIYYTFVRPGLELRLMQVKDIRERTVYIPPERAKNDEGEHVEIAPGLEKLIQQHQLRNYPSNYYIFTSKGKPGETPVGKNYFYKRHSKILRELGLTDREYTIYGYKHTGAINLYRITKDIKLVQRHCRHAMSKQTDEYLRDLGEITSLDGSGLPDF
jgi:hypothetical protein